MVGKGADAEMAHVAPPDIPGSVVNEVLKKFGPPGPVFTWSWCSPKEEAEEPDKSIEAAAAVVDAIDAAACGNGWLCVPS